MRVGLGYALFTFFLSIPHISLMGEDVKNRLSARFSSKITEPVDLNYYLYFPDNYEYSHLEFPLVLFLHGAGERGSELDSVQKHGIPKMINEGQEFPFITLAPQCPDSNWWSEPIYVETLILLVEETIETYRVDDNHVYATGLSMGGYGTLSVAIKRPDLFSAIAPICGGTDAKDIKRLKNVPIWLFHGELDKAVSVENSLLVYEILKPINPNVKITVYENVGHNSWDVTYNNKELYEWMLKH